MKNNLLSLILILMGNFVLADNLVTIEKNKRTQDPLLKTTVINVFDTVVFDLSQEIVTATYVEFPVYFLSDDTINALDFSLKFDLSKFAYDTIIDQTNYLSVISHLAPDSVLRLTSYSLQGITNDTPLVSIRFTKITGQPLCNDDIDSIYSYPIHGYLNGDPSSVKIINCVTSGIEEVNNRNRVNIFPNPANSIVNILSDKIMNQISICNLLEETIFNLSIDKKETAIDVSTLSKGIYFIKVTTGNHSISQKLVIW